jgi:chromosome segregation ATPase
MAKYPHKQSKIKNPDFDLEAKRWINAANVFADPILKWSYGSFNGTKPMKRKGNQYEIMGAIIDKLGKKGRVSKKIVRPKKRIEQKRKQKAIIIPLIIANKKMNASQDDYNDLFDYCKEIFKENTNIEGLKADVKKLKATATKIDGEIVRQRKLIKRYEAEYGKAKESNRSLKGELKKAKAGLKALRIEHKRMVKEFTDYKKIAYEPLEIRKSGNPKVDAVSDLEILG